MSSGQSTGSAPGKSYTEAAALRRKQILSVACELFCVNGYDATSISMIAERVGILKGSIYYHFKSKDELLFEILNEFHLGAANALAQASDAAAPVEKRLHRIVRSHLEFAATDVSSARVFLANFSKLEPELRAPILAVRDDTEQLVISLIEGGISKGVFCGKLNPRLAAFAVFGVMNSLCYWYRPGKGDLAEVADTWANFAINGLHCPADGAHRGICRGIGPSWTRDPVPLS